LPDLLPATSGLLGLSGSVMTSILGKYGYLVVGVSVAIESSGIPFPGETVLVTAAVYAGTGHIAIAWVIVAAAAGAIIGDNLGYTAGRYGGRPLVERYGRFVHLRPEALGRAEQFFNRYGDSTVFFGRFVAVLRAWVAFLAGTNRMPWPRFLLFNAAGGIVWATGFGVLGFELGHNLPLLHTIERVIGIGGVAAAVVAVVVIYLGYRLRRKKRS